MVEVSRKRDRGIFVEIEARNRSKSGPLSRFRNEEIGEKDPVAAALYLDHGLLGKAKPVADSDTRRAQEPF